MAGAPILCWQMTPDQAPQWRDIRLEALASAPDAYGTRLSDWQHRPLREFAARLADVPTFASGDSEARPLAVAAWIPAERMPDRAWLISVYARPEGRGRGYAQAVIDHVCDVVRARGMVEIGLDVGVHNGAARSLYTRLGFVASPEPPHLNENGIPEMPMIRRL